jgi:hypothetical protein
VTALFADTFYWIAVSDVTDSAHRLALELTSRVRDVPIVTTDEVLTDDRHFEQEGFRALFRDF